MAKKMSVFMGDLIKNGRLNHPKKYSQSELARLLGYKNGQFISNVERNLCSLPTKMLPLLSHVLKIDIDEIKTAMVRDYAMELEHDIKLYSEGDGDESE